jgi:myo-inositol-1(or 4)-monophosphatase
MSMPADSDDRWLAETLDWTEGVAREAGALLRASVGRAEGRTLKRRRELVTDADRASEEVIVGRIRSRFPDHAVVAEEAGGRDPGSGYLWWVDPLDGTNNYAHGFPHFSVSVALEETGRGVVLGLVYDPMRDECFRAAAGGPAELNRRAIRVSDIGSLEDAIAATGFPYDREKDNENNLPEFNRMILAVQGIRRAGSAALDLSYVAAGRLDAYWELKLKPWDVAAGGIIVKRAGGTVTNIGSTSWEHRTHHIAASNGRVHDEMQRILGAARDGHALP